MTRTIEFQTELKGSSALDMPPEVAASLPSSGKAIVVVFLNTDPDDAAWRRDAYKQFLADDSEEDASDQSDWHEFVKRTYGSCAGLGLDEPEDLPMSESDFPA